MKTIKADFSKAINLTDDQLAVIAAIIGKDIKIGNAPLIGTYMYVNGERHVEKEPELTGTLGGLHISYEWSESGELVHIYVGTEWHGPVLGWHGDGWRNCYSHGNFGKNYSKGGTWSAENKRVYPTMKEALMNRDYVVGCIKMTRATMTEGNGLFELLYKLAEQE